MEIEAVVLQAEHKKALFLVSITSEENICLFGC